MKRKITNLFYKILRVYWRIFKPITLGVRAFVVNDKNEILLVKHTYQNNWFLPGGGVDKGETFEQAIRRELIEETGYEADIIELFGVYQNTYEGKRDNIVVFVCKNGRFIESSPSPEIEKHGFFGADNLPENTAKGMRKRVEEFCSPSESNHFGIW
ncbi:MAG: NUDIX domain-containing protein [Oscillospiraceae bacterium]|nr:NUDIX domain-containing protein [Oscillospiraceae bacterium]